MIVGGCRGDVMALNHVLCSGAVLCVTMSSSGEQCFSGGVDGTIQSWNTPEPNTDPYDSYGTSRDALLMLSETPV